MDLFNDLNRRHKTALFATLLCVGLIVLNDGSVRACVGIGLLGAAFSYVFGTNSRLVHWTLLILGALLLGVVIWDGYAWPKTKRELTEIDTSEIEADRFIVQEDLKDSEVLKHGELAKVMKSFLSRRGRCAHCNRRDRFAT